MAESGLDSLRQQRPISVTWKSFELRPPESPPISEAEKQRYRERIKSGAGRMQEHARTVFGLEMKSGRPGTSSRLAHQAAKWAAAHGKDDEYRHLVFTAHWQQDRDISQLETLKELAVECELDPESLEKSIHTGEFLQQVLEEEGEAMEYGIGGVPAFVFAERYLVSGAQPPDVLVRINDKVWEELEKLESGAPPQS